MMHKKMVLLVTALALATISVTSSAVAQQRDAEVALQQAMHVEQVQGDLERAIQLYRDIVARHSGTRAVAAKALLQLGLCYEKLGRTEAQNAYERLVREYGDQSEVAAAARARLAALSQQVAAAAPTGRVARMLLSDEDTDVNHFFDMRVSPDGRRIVYTDLGYTGAVYIRDLASGDTTKVADGWATFPIWSADGRKIAYSTVTEWGQPNRTTLSILDLTTGESTTPGVVEQMSVQPIDWSPDGELLACWVRGDDGRPGGMAIVSLATGDTTFLAHAHQNSSAAFSPDGRYVAFSDTLDGNTDVYVVDVATRERHRITVSSEPEGRPRWSPSGDVLVYVTLNRGTWAVPMAGGTPTAAARAIASESYDQPAGWASSGQYFYVKYNTVRQLFRIPIDLATMTAPGPVEPLPITQEGMGSFSWSPDMSRIANGKWRTFEVYSFEDQQLETYQIGPDYQSPSPWWSSDGSEIRFTHSRNPEGVTVATLNLASGNVREQFPRIPGVGLLRPSSDGRKMVFCLGDRNSRELKLVVADIGNRDGVVLADETEMQDGRLARWVRPQLTRDGSNVLYGTQGHQVGGRDFRYQLWVAAADGSEEPRRIASAYWIPFAAWHPAGTYVVFNTYDDDEMGPGGLFVVDVRTGEQHEIELPPGLEAMEVHEWSPDGKWIGVATTSGSYELWVVENVLSDRAGGR